jgi:hypothetical protein
MGKGRYTSGLQTKGSRWERVTEASIRTSFDETNYDAGPSAETNPRCFFAEVREVAELKRFMSACCCRFWVSISYGRDPDLDKADTATSQHAFLLFDLERKQIAL